MASFSSLPEEILCYIISFAHPAALISLILVNRKFLACSETALREHRHLYVENRQFDDRKPLNLPSTLREIASNPSIAWYKRNFLVCGLREGWHHWKAWVSEIIDEDASSHSIYQESRANVDDQTHLDASFYAQSELTHFREVLTGPLRLSAKVANTWMQKLDSGYDEPLKVVLIAQCPQLTSLKFMMYDTWISIDSARSHPLTLLGRCITKLHAQNVTHSQWPGGFRSLKEIVAGEFLGSRHPLDAFYAPSSAVCPLFLLPNLERLELTMVMDSRGTPDVDDGFDDSEVDSNDGNESKAAIVNDGGGRKATTPARSRGRLAVPEAGTTPGVSNESLPYIFPWGRRLSAVEKLTLNMCQLDPKTVSSFILACRNLRKLRLDLGSLCGFRPEIFDAVAEHSTTLQSLELSSIAFDKYHSLNETVANFEQLYRLVVPACYLINYEHEVGTKRLPNSFALDQLPAHKRAETCLRLTEWLDFHKCLPTSLRMLRIKHETSIFFSEQEGMALTRALIDLIDGSNRNDTKQFRLSNLCIASIPFPFPSQAAMPDIDKLSWLCDRKGIEIHGLRGDCVSEKMRECLLCRERKEDI
jgi:hypothetical protein